MELQKYLYSKEYATELCHEPDESSHPHNVIKPLNQDGIYMYQPL
jgi:hypothetical protein